MDLERALREKGTARLEVTADQPVYKCRRLLIEAAIRADVRISIRRVTEEDPKFEVVVATVLSPEEAQLQIDRDRLFRAVNDIRDIAGEIKNTNLKEDLKDIADEIEDYARKIGGGVREDSPFAPDAVPAPDGSQSSETQRT